jgi:4-amino-4-deoxy-L-arabinose transferase-like glycosyltransferase
MPARSAQRLSRLSLSREAALAGAAVLAYLALALYRLESPGRVFDTLYNEYLSMQIVDGLKAGDFGVLWRVGWPVYHGRVTAQLMLPFFLALGPSWTLVRLWPIVFGAATLAAGYFLARTAFDRRVALAAVWLAAVHPAFVMGTKLGQAHVSSMIFFSTLSLLLLALWTRRGGTWRLFLSGLCVGIGLGTRLWFSWFAAVYFLALPAFARLKSAPPMGRRGPLAVLAGVVAGSWPMILTEWQWSFASFKSILLRDHADPYEVPLRDVLTGPWDRLSRLLDGPYFYDLYFGADALPPPSLASAALWACVGVSIALCFRKRDPARPWRILLTGVFLALFVVASLGTMGWRNVLPNKYFLFYPLAQILIASALAGLWDAFPRRPVRALCLAAAGAFAVSEAAGAARYLDDLRRLGGRNFSSDAVYGQADWLKTHLGPADGVVYMDADSLLNSRFLLAGTGIRLLDFTYLSTSFELPDTEVTFLDRFEKTVRPVPGTLYVVQDLLAGWHPAQAYWGLIRRWAAERRLRWEKQAVFGDGPDRPLYEIYRLVSLEKAPLRRILEGGAAKR